jgi:hypothetical protein
MKTLITYSRQLLLALGLAAVQSCAHHAAELPVPVPAAASSLSVSEARAWYQNMYPSAAIATGSSQPSSVAATAGGTSTAAELAWSRALTVGQGTQQLVLVPLVGDEALFAHTKYAGPRYLIVAKAANNTLEGNVLELLLPHPATSLDTLGLFTSLYRSYHSGQLVAPGVSEGFLFFYSPDYAYVTGRHFQQGQLQPQAIRLAFAPRGTTEAAKSATYEGLEVSTTNNAPPIGNTCYDWYQESGGKYVYITSTGDCSYGGDGGASVPYPYTSGGGPAVGGYTGPGGYGGGGASNPIAEDGIPSIGDHAKIMKYQYDAATEIDILLEWTASTHEIDKVSLTTVGLSYGSTFVPYGNGIGSYVASSNSYNYSALCQFVAGTAQTGNIANGTLFRIYGTYYASTGRYTINMQKQ